MPSVRLHNLYGPTEAAIDVTHWACDPPAEGSETDASPPIGRPDLQHTAVTIRDEALQPLPDGVPGEIYLAGTGLAREAISARPG